MTSHSTKLMTSEHKQINPVRSKTPMVSADSQSNRTSNGADTPLKPHTSLQPQYHSKAGYGARQGRQVFVGLSGGVDSSVSAALLKKATPNNFSKLFGRPTPKGFRGYDVTGVFLKTWQPEFLRGRGVCTETADRRDAMRVAAHLGIPFLELDCEKRYKKTVVDRMVAEYRAGRVPNPDVWCNREIKFGMFWREAKKRGADFIATGHYARIQPRTKNQELRTYELLRGVDKNKDQSYFLWTLTQEHLASTLFPVGGYEKTEVRALAKKFGLPTAERKDSQGICFIGKTDMKEFLQQYIKKNPGDVLDTSGKIIGTHDGAIFYAIGERHGFSVRGETGAGPLYIVSKNMERNTITVAHKNEEKVLQSHRVTLLGTHWINSVPLPAKTYSAHVRYQGTDIPAKIHREEGQSIVSLAQKEFISEGQSLVIYDKEVCIGGGIVRIAQ
ncbi:MAG: tRNA 2-thiouridine(34) synthase MnmA [Patescibacteria group bacterium]